MRCFENKLIGVLVVPTKVEWGVFYNNLNGSKYIEI